MRKRRTLHLCRFWHDRFCSFHRSTKTEAEIVTFTPSHLRIYVGGICNGSGIVVFAGFHHAPAADIRSHHPEGQKVATGCSDRG